MAYKNETALTPPQVHLLRSLLDGKRQITEQEAQARIRLLGLNDLVLPCAVICISPYYSGVPFEKKDTVISLCSDFICRFFQREDFRYYCLTNSYDNFQVIFPTAANKRSGPDLEEVFIRLRQLISRHFSLELFIGIGSAVWQYTEISRSALEAMEMLAFKNQYSDRGVINIANTSRFKHYSLYGEDIMFARVIGQFKDGNLGMMSSRLNELIESIRNQPGVSGTSIRRTFIELAVSILRIASNANVDTDDLLNGLEVYNWVLKQTHTEVLTDWLLDLSGKLLERMEMKQETAEKEIITQACAYIDEHLSDPFLSLQSVSDAVKLSCNYFSQLFKAEKGIGLNNYITECRIAQAQQLLSGSEMKSEDIALQLGFASSTYFSRVFKKSTGMTPSAYRKQNSGA